MKGWYWLKGRFNKTISFDIMELLSKAKRVALENSDFIQFKINQYQGNKSLSHNGKFLEDQMFVFG